MGDFYKFLTDEKMFIMFIGAIGIIAASMQEWQTAGLVISGGVGYLKGYKDGQTINP